MTIATQKLTFEEYLACDGTNTRYELGDGLVPRIGTGRQGGIAEFLNNSVYTPRLSCQLVSVPVSPRA